jgi:predicted lipoprotein with Yx(FWY)xxD motif
VKRVLISVAVAAAVTLPAAFADAKGVRAKLELRRTAVGTILVNGRGFTVYAFARDSRNKDACQAIRLCLTVWPPVTTTGKPLAGPGVRANLIGTIRLRSGVKQVTYAGHPLYTYVADTRPAETFFVNIPQFGGRWPAVNSAGHDVK